MPHSQAFDPVVTRTGTEKIATPFVASVISQALRARCRMFTTSQTVVPELAQ